MKTKDRTNTTCPLCNRGTLLERSLNDDWDGLLTCGECHQRVERYEISQTDDNVYQLFSKQDKQESMISSPHKVSSSDIHISEQSLREHFEFFLGTLDISVEEFNSYSVMDKKSLYKTLVDFTHTFVDSYLKLKGE